MPVGSRVADNFAHGGIAAPVKIATGEVGAAVSKSVAGMVRGDSFPTHPDTGRPIAGLRLPNWQEVLDLCVRAHARFSEFHSIGWDVAIAEDGPILIEGNENWDPVVSQQPGRNPVGLDPLIDHMVSFFRAAGEEY